MKAFRYIRTSAVQIIQTEPNLATVVELYVDPDDRKRHLGTRLMQATCRDADREGVTLLIEPHPFGSYDVDEEVYYPPGLSYKELCAFYRTFGFRFMPKSKFMKRLPKEN